MIIIVGLGNPGKEYQNTRHNAGFMVAEEIVKSEKLKVQNCSLKFKINKKFNAEIAEFEYQGEKIILVKPQTFMNNSGLAVKKIQQFSNFLWVIHDDLDLNLGEVRIVQNRGAGGHHGVESIINHLKTQNFVRFRIGIRTKPKEQCLISAKDYVLGEFKGEEKKVFKESIQRCAEAVDCALENDLDKAMNKYNSTQA